MHNNNLRKSPPQKINCPILITPSLVLRLPHIADIEDINRLVDEKSVANSSCEMSFPFLNTDAKDFVKRAENWEEGSYIYAITHSETGEFIGTCGISSYSAATANDTGSLDAKVSDKVIAGISTVKNEQSTADSTIVKSSDRSKAEIFFWLGSPYRRQGYGAEVTTALVDTAFRATELESLYARVANNNTLTARQILRDCGFTLQPDSHKNDEQGVQQDCVHYGLTRNTWFDLRTANAS